MEGSSDAVKTAEVPFFHTLSDSGDVLPAFLDQAKIAEIKGRELRGSEVFIASFPKSGSTWIKSMLMDLLSVDIPMYCTVPGDPSAHTTRSDMVIYKEHLPLHLMPHGIENCKVIYLIRNPKDVVVSFQHHMNLFTMDGYEGDLATMVKLFCSGKTQFGDWMTSVKGWCLEGRIKNLLLVSYEDMISDSYYTMRKVLDFLGQMTITDADLRSVVENSRFDKMKKRDLNYVPGCPSFFGKSALRDGAKHFLREGKVGGWKKHLSVENSEEIDKYIERDEGVFELLKRIRIL